MDNLLDKSGDKPESVDKSKPAEKPVSLHPLKFEEAVRGLLKVRPSSTRVPPGVQRTSGGSGDGGEQR